MIEISMPSKQKDWVMPNLLLFDVGGLVMLNSNN